MVPSAQQKINVKVSKMLGYAKDEITFNTDVGTLVKIKHDVSSTYL